MSVRQQFELVAIVKALRSDLSLSGQPGITNNNKPKARTIQFNIRWTRQRPFESHPSNPYRWSRNLP